MVNMKKRITKRLKRFCGSQLQISLLPLATSFFSCMHILGCSVEPSVTPTRPRVPNNWSIGILRGAALEGLHSSQVCPNPVLTKKDIDIPESVFVADPFLVREAGEWFLFFELFNKLANKGEIGLATSTDLCSWRYKGVVLAEAFHLSFPYVFKVRNSYYMVPESRQSGAIRLYKATSFPSAWRFERELVVGNYSDPTPVYFDGRWWIFANLSPYTLAIFSSKSLKSPFVQHPQSPMYQEDLSKARPAGRPVLANGKLVRFVQDNREGYGKRVRAMRVNQLDLKNFSEEPLLPDPLLRESGQGWNSFGMHHISPVRLPNGSWVAAVDGNSE